jgi:hypothetical protein
MQLQAVWLDEEPTQSSKCRLPSIWSGRCWLRERANLFKLTRCGLIWKNLMALRRKRCSRRESLECSSEQLVSWFKARGTPFISRRACPAARATSAVSFTVLARGGIFRAGSVRFRSPI